MKGKVSKFSSGDDIPQIEVGYPIHAGLSLVPAR